MIKFNELARNLLGVGRSRRAETRDRTGEGHLSISSSFVLSRHAVVDEES